MAGRECRYSGVRRGIGSIWVYWGSLGELKPLGGVRGCQVGIRGVWVYLGAGRECRCS